LRSDGWPSKRALIPFLLLLALVFTGCGSGEPGPSSAATGSGSGGPSASAGAPATTSSPSAAPSGPTELPVQHEGTSIEIDPGTYITAKPDGFFPGLTLTIPPGWFATEADSGEINLHPVDRKDDGILLWKDLVPVVPNNRSGKAGQPLKGVGTTADALVKWLTSTSDFAILAKPKTVTIGDGVKGKQLTLTTSKHANFADKGCPANPRCAAIFTDPDHWFGEFYAIGGNEVSRIFVTTLHYPEGDHTFFVTLDAPSAHDLAPFASEAQPIIDSLRLPSTYVAN
jgi:hypothetical protein